MPVTPDDVRVYLPPEAVNSVPDLILESFIAAWKTRADLATGGVSADDNSAIFEAIRLGAASSGWRVMLRGIPQAEEPGQIKAMREEAESLIRTLDALTVGPQEEESAEQAVGTVDEALIDAPEHKVSRPAREWWGG